MTVQDLLSLSAEVLGADREHMAEASQVSCFAALGGDSLQAMLLSARAENDLGLRVPMGGLLSGESLAAVLSAAVPSPGRAAVPSRDPDSTHDLTPVQHGILVQDQLIGGSAYNLAFTLDIRGQLDVDSLGRALRRTVARHEELQSVFPTTGSSTDLRREVVRDWFPILERLDIPQSCDDIPADLVRAVIEAEGHRLMVPGERPAMRVILVSAQEARHVLVLVMHHVLVDGWGVGLLIDELLATYEDEVSGTGRKGPASERNFQVGDAPESLAATEQQARFWLRALQDFPHELELPSDLKRPEIQDPRGARLPFQLPSATSQALGKVARHCQVTPFTMFLAAYGLVLSRYTGQRRLVIGVPVASRADTALQSLLAPALHVLPVGIEVDDTSSISTYVRKVRDSLAAAMRHSTMPLHAIARVLGVEPTLRHPPLIQAVMAMHDRLIRRYLAGDLALPDYLNHKMPSDL